MLSGLLLRQGLAANAARGHGAALRRIGYHDGHGLHQALWMRCHGGMQGGAFGADACRKGGVLLVAASHDLATVKPQRRTHAEVRVSGVGTQGGLAGALHELAVACGQLVKFGDRASYLESLLFRHVPGNAPKVDPPDRTTVRRPRPTGPLAKFDPLTSSVNTPLPAIARFAPISLAEMDGVKLQDRNDTKYVFGQEQLAAVLERMLDEYRILEVGGVRGTAYRSLYLDTPDLRHYRDHHNSRTLRSKVRFREYVGSGLVYLEVKRKTGRGRTDKVRMLVKSIPDTLSPEQASFVASANGGQEVLVPSLWNHFTRYTFVHKRLPERLTMDLDLRFSGPDGESPLGGIVVAELKQERIDRRSTFARIMRDMGIRPAGMSKYCVGMLMLHRPVKHNAFKPVLRMLERIRQAA